MPASISHRAPQPGMHGNVCMYLWRVCNKLVVLCLSGILFCGLRKMITSNEPLQRGKGGDGRSYGAQIIAIRIDQFRAFMYKVCLSSILYALQIAVSVCGVLVYSNGCRTNRHSTLAVTTAAVCLVLAKCSRVTFSSVNCKFIL